MKLKVAVFFGGESVEHEISIISAHQAIENLDTNKYDVIPVYISKNREFYVGEALNDLGNFANISSLLPKLTQVNLVKVKDKVYIEPIKKGLFTKPINTIDIAMPVVHGTNGEDGSLQGLFEMLKLPYCGCMTIPAGVGQDKIFMKSILAHHKLPLVDWYWVYAQDLYDNKEKVLAQVKEFGFPVILKPACLGSSVGIEVAHNEEEFLEALEETGKYDFKVIIEKYINDFVEVNCSVKGTFLNPKASVIEQVAKESEILSYVDKYGNQGSKAGTKGKLGCKTPTKGSKASKGMASANRIIPAPLSDNRTKEIQTLAIDVFKTLQASGIARIDFMINQENNDVYVTEINTIPGSLAFYLWSETGIPFNQLLDEMIEDALDIYRRKENMTFSFESNVLQGYKK